MKSLLSELLAANRGNRRPALWLLGLLVAAMGLVVVFAAALVLSWWRQETRWVVAALAMEGIMVVLGFLGHHFYGQLRRSRSLGARGPRRIASVKPRNSRPLKGRSLWQRIRIQVLTLVFILFAAGCTYAAVKLSPVLEEATFGTSLAHKQ